MANESQAPCSACRARAATSSGLGLDELMIVNPEGAADIFQGKDGALYQLNAPREGEPGGGLGLFLAADGSVYRAEPRGEEPAAASSSSAGLSGYLLAADGTLYEISPSASHAHRATEK